MKVKYFNWALLLLFGLMNQYCQAQQAAPAAIRTGAERLEQYLPLLEGKSVALLVNHTSTINTTHLLDTLLGSGVTVQRIFAPEHGFRGNQANGEQFSDDKDEKTGLPILSLYGKNKRPKPEHLADIDVVIYDIQDVGVRFYTYISSMHYMMEACANQNVAMIILDRPNPNAGYIDGPVLETDHTSFVGMHPIPIVYAMTHGEVARMIVGEQWITGANDLDLTVIPLQNWTHDRPYKLPIRPSPNLPNDHAIALYPSLCLFEGTNISVGRGTSFPFEVVGYPDTRFGPFEFTPQSIPGVSNSPKHQNKKCYGRDLRQLEAPRQLDLSLLISYYQLSQPQEEYFNSFFTKLAGTERLRSQIEAGLSEQDIRASWQADLDQFKAMRNKYLLYE